MLQDLDLVAQFHFLQHLRLALGKWPDGDATDFVAGLPGGLESLFLAGLELPIRDIADMLSKSVQSGRLSKLKSFRYRSHLEQQQELEVQVEVSKAFEGTGVDYHDESFGDGN